MSVVAFGCTRVQTEIPAICCRSRSARRSSRSSARVRRSRVRALVAVVIVGAASVVSAQQPFYTDDASTTEKYRFHFEFFNEFDRLQTEQFPNNHQNTANYKLNYGLTNNVELDVDNPYLAILRTRVVDPRL